MSSESIEPAGSGAPAHDLKTFVEQVTAEMGSEYERIRSRSSEDPGTAGDEGEENWASLLREWLPGQYSVVTKGRLLSTTGEMSPQLDVVVLKPAYPPKLRERKTYLADGVAAAFECKLTLRSEHIAQATKTAALLPSLFQDRKGAPYAELHSPLCYGLLAHSHAWTGKQATPKENITGVLLESDLEHCEHPKCMLDLVCVASLGTWTPMRMAGIGPFLRQGWDASRDLYKLPQDGGVLTSYQEPGHPGQDSGNPIGNMLSRVIRRLAHEDGELRPIADYFRLALPAAGQGRPRPWPWDVYSSETRAGVLMGRLTNGKAWDPWSMAFF